MLFSLSIIAQTTVRGNIKASLNNSLQNLPGAIVILDGTNNIVITNNSGDFVIETSRKFHTIIVNYIGFKPDTIDVYRNDNISIILVEDNNIGDVTISQQQKGSYISDNSNLYVKTITTAGLQQLPCCNLSESFENTADVDVAFTDAISGAKQIQMLGLAGVYTQILTENIPSVRGLASTYGLSYIPGSWMESIQISKGTATVINGYESVTGQINIELKKPDNNEKLFFNVYGNSMGRIEANANSSIEFSDKLSTIFLLHKSNSIATFDFNNDGFVDLPKNNQFNIINKWKFKNNKGFETQLGFKALVESRVGGQLEYFNTNNNEDYYGINVNTNHYEVFYKIGTVINFIKGASVGSTFSASYHNQNSFYGYNIYKGLEKSFYGNIIFAKEIFTHQHKINFGTSLLLDDYAQKFNANNFYRNEIVPGIFAQYTFEIPEKISYIIGYRLDFHNIYGVFNTVRAHFKYHISHNTTLRLSGGKGYRVANIFAENVGLMATSRNFNIVEELEPEKAWNYGISLTQNIQFLNHKTIQLSFEYFRTNFDNQIIADVDADYSQVYFYNLRGNSFSNSFQTNATFELFKGLVLNLAFRYNDVKITMQDVLTEKPLVNKYKGLLTFSYLTKNNKWVFDFTNQFVGKAKLPIPTNNPTEIKLDEYSPAFYLLHAQITKKFKHFEIYTGSENLTNFTQKQPIISSSDPFGEFFDASIIWGPITGRTIYAGARFTIN